MGRVGGRFYYKFFHGVCPYIKIEIHLLSDLREAFKKRKKNSGIFQGPDPNHQPTLMEKMKKMKNSSKQILCEMGHVTVARGLFQKNWRFKPPI